MRNSLMILALGVMLISSACNPDPVIEITTDINLNFVASYGDELFMTDHPYGYENGVNIQFDQFNFFISSVVLLKEIEVPGNELDIKEIALMDFSAIDNPVDAANGLSITAKNLPVGDYQGIKFGIGVPSGLNRSKPYEYSQEHPLSSTELYEPEYNSYIFSQLIGQVDQDGDGVLDGNFSYNSATNNLYKELVFATKVTLTENSTHIFKLNIDIERLLGTDGDRIDVVNNPTESDFNISQLIANNFAAAITVK